MMIFARGPEGRPLQLSRPLAILHADRPEEVRPALESAGAALGQGLWIGGYVAYEAGYALEPKLAGLMPPGRRPLVRLAICEGPDSSAEAEPQPEEQPVPDLGLIPEMTAADHARAVERVLELIGAGDIYQINLTFPLRGRLPAGLSPRALYRALLARQAVGHAALIDLPGAPAILSLSPESFFETDPAGGIRVRPMKGTRPRHPDPEKDLALREDLRQAVKDRAENLMIVDLMRNDLSRICLPGSVKVPRLFEVESYATVHQMVSEVTGRLAPDTGLATIFAGLFPCGSVTGAPKIRAMQVIRALEAAPRGVYCGAVGWAAPDGRAAFNVAIRTLTVARTGAVTLNVGGGIVADSTAAGEWEEALWKTRFAKPG